MHLVASISNSVRPPVPALMVFVCVSNNRMDVVDQPLI